MFNVLNRSEAFHNFDDQLLYSFDPFKLLYKTFMHIIIGRSFRMFCERNWPSNESYLLSNYNNYRLDKIHTISEHFFQLIYFN